MSEYRPIDLSAWCNAGIDSVKGDAPPATGAQSFRGLPFQVGSETSDRCFIRLEADASPLSIPIGEAATYVLVAHRLLNSRLEQGEPAGAVVAQYIFRLEGGIEVEVPVRERFEIADPRVPGALPFRAMPDQNDQLRLVTGDAGKNRADARRRRCKEGRRTTSCSPGKIPTPSRLWSPWRSSPKDTPF